MVVFPNRSGRGGKRREQYEFHTKNEQEEKEKNPDNTNDIALIPHNYNITTAVTKDINDAVMAMLPPVNAVVIAISVPTVTRLACGTTDPVTAVLDCPVLEDDDDDDVVFV